MLRTSHRSGRQRRGMILIVVLSLLTLFAIVGISFVLVSDSMALSSKIAREGESSFRPDVDPEAAFSLFMGQLVYDVEDDEIGIYSGLRGHSFGRTIYGYNSDTMSLNDKAFSGLGRLRIASPYAGNAGAGPAQWLGYMVNHTYFSGDGFLHDPERISLRANLAGARGAYVSAAASYTYPDHNNFFLAAADSSGRILMPSFHRPWLFGSLDPTNTNWTSAWGKYLTPRPRPAEHPGFPMPEDAGGDVKNRIGAPGGNDSIWIDINAPVMTSADGRKYKMLFAPLILDLDGRVNVNVHGNQRGASGAHGSSQGWGPWEINPERVLTAGELRYLLAGNPTTGNARTAGRYGTDRQPSGTGSSAPGSNSPPRAWSQVDFDADGTARWQLPSETVPFRTVPLYPANFANGDPAERQNHPALYNSVRSNSDDRLLPASAMASLLRRGDTGGQGLTSDLMRLLPGTTANGVQRNLITTHSADIDRPAAVPYIWSRNPAEAPGTAYAWNAAANVPLAQGEFLAPFNAIATSRGATPATSEFNPVTWHSQLASMLRVNLNRRLAAYPAVDSTSGVIVDTVGYDAAWRDRVFLAQDLYDRLWRVTGAVDPATAPAVGTDEFRTLRWLAQLAVNMVDFIDSDDTMTIFPWYPSDPAQLVIGTEMPSLLINEVFAQFENLPNDAALANRAMNPAVESTSYRINVWAELFNPRVDGPTGPTAATRLLANGQPVYQLTLASYAMASQAQTVLSNNDNVLGDPEFGGINAVEKQTVQDWAAATATVAPGGDQYSNNGFYVVGPQNTFLNEPGVDPNLPVTHRSPQMTLAVPQNGSRLERRPTLFLRRLVCPDLPPGPNNPYVTIDTFQYPEAPHEANAWGHGNAANNQNGNVTAMQRDQRRSWGRYQPFTALDMRQQNPNPAEVNASQHTFLRHNYEGAAAPALNAPSNTLKTSGFDWLAHLDRQVVSPLELTLVSVWKPHQLTEKFVTAPGNPAGAGGTPQAHLAQWFNPATRLTRFLEFVQTAPRTVNLSPGGRVPGKVNINTINDPRVFSALCDGPVAGGNTNNRFTDAQVQNLYTQLVGRRQPGGVSAYSATDRPFRSIAEGTASVAPAGDEWTAENRGSVNTLLTPSAPGAPLLLDPHGATLHPAQNIELLNKIFNNTTTRSNVFAVWVTVGYFEVTNENVRPVRLGAEIGRTEGRHIRHRMFAIVDRTKMEAIRLNGAFASPTNAVAGQRNVAVFASATAPNSNTGKTWTLADGAILTFQPDSDIAETTALRWDAGTSSFRGEVFRSYTTATMPIIQYGNPGPWLRYNPKQDPCMLYFSVID